MFEMIWGRCGRDVGNGGEMLGGCWECGTGVGEMDD